MNITETLIRALQTQREDLDQAIQALQRVNSWGQAEENPSFMTPHDDAAKPAKVPGADVVKPTNGNPPPPSRNPGNDGDRKMTGWEACREVLRRHGEAMTVPEIVMGLEARDFHIGSDAKRSYVSTAIRRRSDIFFQITDRPGAPWCLREWAGHRRP
jgi:hypothetical protein